MPTGTLPAKATRQWEHVYRSELARGLPPGRAAAAAWATVKRSGYMKCGNRWVKSSGRRCVRGRMV